MKVFGRPCVRGLSIGDSSTALCALFSFDNEISALNDNLNFTWPVAGSSVVRYSEGTTVSVQVQTHDTYIYTSHAYIEMSEISQHKT